MAFFCQSVYFELGTSMTNMTRAISSNFHSSSSSTSSARRLRSRNTHHHHHQHGQDNSQIHHAQHTRCRNPRCTSDRPPSSIASLSASRSMVDPHIITLPPYSPPEGEPPAYSLTPPPCYSYSHAHPSSPPPRTSTSSSTSSTFSRSSLSLGRRNRTTSADPQNNGSSSRSRSRSESPSWRRRITSWIIEADEYAGQAGLVAWY
ncbi:hypothetical protein DFS34DRAFT_615573 [Phlyctochytrium arcticum]|nr:hypothetical protein DFS34DRAFT_615573 [Phlyctochytrium arcticum]